MPTQTATPPLALTRVPARSRVLLTGLVVVLALLGGAAVVSHFLVEPYNPAFIDHAVITRTHVVLGGVYLLWAPFQFVARIRDRHPAYHRRSGRVLVGIGLVVGVTALFLGVVIAFGGNAERVVIGAFGGLFLLALVLGVVRIRQGRVAQHREWMIRAFAIGLSVATMRLMLIPALMLTDLGDDQVAWLFVISFTVAFAIHAGVAELWIRRTRA
jgi:uncharacterized membrane protein